LWLWLLPKLENEFPKPVVDKHYQLFLRGTPDSICLVLNFGLWGFDGDKYDLGRSHTISHPVTNPGMELATATPSQTLVWSWLQPTLCLDLAAANSDLEIIMGFRGIPSSLTKNGWLQPTLI